MTRVLVTGGAGFLGTSAVAALSERCERVVSAAIRTSGSIAVPTLPAEPADGTGPGDDIRPDARSAPIAERVDVTGVRAVRDVMTRIRRHSGLRMASSRLWKTGSPRTGSSAPAGTMGP